MTSNLATPALTDHINYPEFWAKACEHLSKQDRIMRRLIAGHPNVCLESRGDAFATLARSIVGQQISVKAAQTIWERLLEACNSSDVPTPAHIQNLSLDVLRKVGLSQRKVEYIQDLAEHFEKDKLNTQQWPEMDDEAIIQDLLQVRGIGRWTAEMFLMFHMLRPNVLPLDDVGLMKGISSTYFSGEPVSRADARELGEAWNPYKTVAVWYIWHSLDPLPVAY